MSLVRLYDVTKNYDARTVFHDVFFRLDEGDRVGLIGKNGVGKTTLLRLILGKSDTRKIDNLLRRQTALLERSEGARGPGHCSPGLPSSCSTSPPTTWISPVPR